jgi:hypothetical protein
LGLVENLLHICPSLVRHFVLPLTLGNVLPKWISELKPVRADTGSDHPVHRHFAGLIEAKSGGVKGLDW